MRGCTGLACLCLVASMLAAFAPAYWAPASARAPEGRCALRADQLEVLEFQQGQLPDHTYSGVQDTYLDLWAPDEARGADHDLVLRGDGAQRPLLKFRLDEYIPPDSMVVQATLYLWMYYANPVSSVVDAGARRVLRGWQESTATWNAPWLAAGCDGPTDRESDHTDTTIREPNLWYWWDVTPAAQAWISDPSANHGTLLLSLPDQPSRRIQFRSSEYDNPEQRPKLMIRFYPGTPPPTATPTPTLTPTPTPTVIPVDCTLEGSVTLQRPGSPRPSTSWVVSLTVSVAGQAHDVATDSSGHFALTGLEAGTFSIGVKHSHTLRRVVPSVLLVVGSNTVDFGTLLEGDADNDNCVNITDFSILASGFSPGYDDRADSNLDGTVNITDFSLLASSFGQCGDEMPGS